MSQSLCSLAFHMLHIVNRQRIMKWTIDLIYEGTLFSFHWTYLWLWCCYSFYLNFNVSILVLSGLPQVYIFMSNLYSILNWNLYLIERGWLLSSRSPCRMQVYHSNILSQCIFLVPLTEYALLILFATSLQEIGDHGAPQLSISCACQLFFLLLSKSHIHHFVIRSNKRMM